MSPLRVSARRAGGDLAALGCRRQPCDRLTPELLADDGCSLEHHPLADREGIETRVEHGRDGRWNVEVAVRPAALADHRGELLDEERIAVCHLDDAAAQRRVGDPEVVEELAAFAWAQRLELDHDRSWRRRPEPAELGSGEPEQHHRSVACPRREVLDEIEQHRLGQVKVVDAEDERAVLRQ